MSSQPIIVPSPEDRADCAREPIRRPGSIQPHGVLFAIDEVDHTILQCSENCAELVGRQAKDALGTRLADVLDPPTPGSLEQAIGSLPATGEVALVDRFELRGRIVSMIAHRSDGLIIVELEADELLSRGQSQVQPQVASMAGMHSVITPFITVIQNARSVAELCAAVSSEVRRITQFDRVLVYQFQPDGTGVVLGESRNDVFPSLQDHHFPASDIPAQARELYRINRLRIIPDASYRPVPLLPENNPRTGNPTDMSHCILRSVSPVHVEYMKNMGTESSMSVSVVVDGMLWGLISCHHATARNVPYEVRSACDLLAQVFALQIANRNSSAETLLRVQQHQILTRLLAYMSAAEDFASGLADHFDDLLAFVGASGVAVVTESGCRMEGLTPTETQVRELVAWLFAKKSEIYSTKHLSGDFEPAKQYVSHASGLLAVSISQVKPVMILWFRPEVIEAISWGGDPRNAKLNEASGGKIHPRQSFETWRETVRSQAVPWIGSEVDAAVQLRSAVLGIVLKNTEELAALSGELQRTNDELQRSNRELEAFSYSVSHDLRAPLRHIVGFAELLKEAATGALAPEDLKHADTIIESSEYAGKLVDNLLSFSRMGRTELLKSPIDLNLLVHEVRDSVMSEITDREIVWNLSLLPAVNGDVMMLRLAITNLFENAIKYTRDRDRAMIDVSYTEHDGMYVFSIKDNGVGFDMRFKDKLFGVFQRLHRWEDFEGTGIGLANVRRIVERHGGLAWAEGEPNVGATFHFSLPIPK